MDDDEKQGNNNQQFGIKPYEPREHSVSTEIRHLEQETDEEIHLRDYIHVVLRRKWIVLLFFISVVVTVSLATFMMKPLYKSTVTIKIDKENPSVLSFEDAYRIERVETDYYQTQYKILKSRNIAKRVIKKLGLDSSKEFTAGDRGVSIKGIIFSLVRFVGRDKSRGKHVVEDGVDTGIVDSFLKRLDVKPLIKSQLVKVSFEAYDPALAKKVANAVAETYIDFNLDSKIEASRQARKWLEKQIEIMKAKVEETEERLNEYSSSNRMIFLDVKNDKQSILKEKLAEFSTALSLATTVRVQKEALYNEIKESGDNNPEILNNSLIQELKKRYVSLESEYYNLLKIYKPEYPKMKRLKSQMSSLQKRVNLETSNIVKSIKSDYQAAVKRESYLNAIFNVQKNKVMEFQKKMVQYQILKREVDTNKELYNNMLQRLKEVGVSATMRATNIQILDRAEYPKYPYKPNKPLNILLSIVLGLFGGVGLAFFMEYFDNTVKDPQDIEKRMNLPALGLIPLYASSDPSERRLITHSDNKGHIAEAFRSIGTFISLSSAARPPKTILITSPGEKEGKTTVTINTATALTNTLGKGVIIDADLRKPKIHNGFDVENSTGLSTFLSGNMEFDEGLIKPTTGVLDVITSGPIPPNPSELLGSARMKDLLDALYSIYDFIIIDSPPVLGMTDSLHLSSFTDGVVIVVRSGQTPRDALTETKRMLNRINAKILGVVINGIKDKDLRYGSYSYYYSSYYKEH